MAEHIPIITSEDAGNIVKKTFGDSAIVRVPLDRASRLLGFVPSGSKAWVDPCVDGCDDIDTRRSKPGDKNNWFEFMSALPHFERLGQVTFLAKPIQTEVNALVKEVLIPRGMLHLGRPCSTAGLGLKHALELGVRDRGGRNLGIDAPRQDVGIN